MVADQILLLLQCEVQVRRTDLAVCHKTEIIECGEIKSFRICLLRLFGVADEWITAAGEEG